MAFRIRVAPLTVAALALAGSGCIETAVHEHEPSAQTSSATAHAGAETRWSYEGTSGPEHWADLAPTFSACKSGKQQAPIALTSLGEPADSKLAPLRFDYPAAPFRLVHDGHTVTAYPSAAAGLSTADGHFDLVQFHFHVPSEHTLDGKHFDAEMHLVHKNAHGDRAVVAFFLSIDDREHSGLAPFFEHAPREAEKEAFSILPLDLASAISTHGSAHADSAHADAYLTYAGSLTTPPCSEGITWFVVTTPRSIGRPQWESLHAMLHGDTNRPLQSRTGRAVSRYAL